MSTNKTCTRFGASLIAALARLPLVKALGWENANRTGMRQWNRGVPPAHFGAFKWCPLCRKPLALYRVCDRVRLACTGKSCNYVQWDGPLPVALAVVEIDGRIVLVRRSVQPNPGSWCLPGGFIEAQETGEEAAIREFCEETGLTVKIERMLGAYTPCHGVNEVILVYHASVTGGTLKPGDDADMVATYGPDDLPDNIAFDKHRRIISDWFAHHALQTSSLTCGDHENR